MSKSVFLKDVLEIQNGFAFDSVLFNDNGNGMPIIRIRDLARGFSETYYSGEYDKRFIVKQGNFLIGMDGEFRCYEWQGENSLLNQRVCRLQNFSDEVNSKYIYYLINKYLIEIENSTAFVTVKHISSKQIANIQIPLPSLPEQERIVRLLDEAEALRTKRAQANERMEDFVPALFEEMFGNPATNPKKWEVVLTEKLFTQTKAGTKCGPFGSALKKSEYVNSGIPVWGIDNVQENEFIEENSLFITQEKFEELSNYEVDAGDILISRAGTVGRMCVAYPKQSPSIIGTNLIRLSFDQNKVVPEYFTAMAMYFSNSLGNLRANADETAYSFVSTKTLRSLLIPVPPLALQQEFAERVKEAREIQSAQERSTERVEALYQSMLDRAFKGEL